MSVLGGSDEQDAGNKGVFLTCSCVKFDYAYNCTAAMEKAVAASVFKISVF